MEYRRLGNSGWQGSLAGLGCDNFGMRLDAEQTRDVVQDIYIRRVEKQGDQLANIEFETIKQVKDPWKELNPPK